MSTDTENPTAQIPEDESDEPAIVFTNNGDAAVAESPSDDRPELDAEEEGKSEPDPTSVRRKRTGVNPNAELTQPPVREVPKGFRRDRGLVLPILNATLSELDGVFTNLPRIDPTGSAAGRAWLGAITEGRDVLTTQDAGVDSLTRDDSLWRQSVSYQDREIAAGTPRLGESQGDAPLVGEEALLRLQTALGGSRLVRVPLWHSGIWINMKAPSEAQLVELERRLTQEKITLGRMTNGLIFSNVSVYHHSFLINFALSLVFDCSVPNFTPEQLKKRILLTDMPTLMWALASTIYPNGYRYHRPCVADPSVCTYVAEELLDLTRLSWTDQAALNDSQRAHMVRKTAKFPDVELERYREQHRYVSKGQVILKDEGGVKVVMQLRVPTLSDYEESGFAWVDTIDAQTTQAFGSTMTGDARNSYILEQAQATSLRQYAHWIKSITINGRQVIDDRKTLEDTVGTLTNDVNVRTAFFEGVRSYISDTTISLIAIPTYSCPSCKLDQQTAEEIKHPHLIPLDMAMVFFTLLGRRVSHLLDAASLI